MCGIFASFRKDRLLKLAEANSYRGAHSHSITRFDSIGISSVTKRLGAFNSEWVQEPGFNLCHIQAPTTTEQEVGNIHPADYRSCKLWHNGIIKTDAVRRLQIAHQSLEKWDTLLLLQDIAEYEFTGLSKIDGSFACFYYNPCRGLYVFRNEISPLFYNLDGDFSSVKQMWMEPVPANTVFKVDIDFATKSVTLTKVVDFTTFDNPYFFME